jgi:putative selenate reductase
VALGLVPVTVCTDLLKTGGYARPAGYFEELGRRMDAVGASTVDEFIVAEAAAVSRQPPAVSRQPSAEARDERRAAGNPPTAAELAAAKLRNTERYVAGLATDPRYAAPRNLKTPRKIGRTLRLFDCLTCDKCIAVCPNDANFTFVLPTSASLPVTEPRQIANFADFCNDCGNCDTFCPEDGGPFRLKPRLFLDRARWLRDAPRDAILIERDAITGRFDGAEYRVADGSDPAADQPTHDLLRRLRAALLAPTEVNYVNTSW